MEMNIFSFIDDNTNNTFYVSSTNDKLELYKKNKIYNYNIIDWCKQYLNQNSTFIDINTDIGNYSIILSKYAKHVYATYVNNYDNYISLLYSLNANNIKNIDFFPSEDQLYNLKHINIGLIKISNANIVDTIKNITPLIIDNYYPPIIYHDSTNSIIEPFVNLGYKVIKLSGVEDMYFACDNINYIQKNKQICYDSQIKNMDDIILSPYSSQQLIETTLYDTRLYMSKLEPLKTWMLNIPLPHNRVPNNPAIYKLPNGLYKCNVRASNYVYDPNFRFLDSHNIHKSDHYMLTLDNNMLITKTVLLKDVTKNMYVPSFVEGFDDLRIINEEYFICSHGNLNTNRIIDQCLGKYDENGNVTSLIKLEGPNKWRHEKNWLAFMDNDEIYVIYTIHPFVLYKINKETGEMLKIKEVLLTNKNLYNFRGSAPPIKYKNGWLCTIHQVCSKPLTYFHRFVWFDKLFEQIIYSKPYYFDTIGIEFNTGIAHHEKGVILSHSVKDNNARLIIVDYNIINQFLEI
jgi:hypothetical protein